MENRLTPEAQAALDAVRAGTQRERSLKEQAMPDAVRDYLDRQRATPPSPVMVALERIEARLERIERLLEQR